MTTTSEPVDGLIDINSDQENTENQYSKNIDYYQKYIDYYQKYIDLLKENKDLETEKENYKFNLTKYQEIIEPTYNEKIRKLKEKNKIITQEKEFYFDNFTKYQKEIEPKYKEKINSLTQDLSNYEREFKGLLQYKKEAERLYEVERLYNAKIGDIKAENEKHNSDKERINNLEKKTIELETNVHSKAFMIETTEKLNKELQFENANVKKDAPSYQSALEDTLNFCLSDPVKLSTDINSLQDKLEKYVTTLKGQIKIDNSKIQGLYGKYNLDTQNLTDKNLMKSVLQRHVLEKILECIDNYLEIKNDDEPNNPINQEKYIMYYTDKLIDFLEKFYGDHFEQDNNVIKTIPTKIHQQVYDILGEFGFSEAYENNKNQHTHPFISSTALELNQLMAGYRYINDDNKRKNVENMAENLIKDVVRIFKFRLLVQEPKYETHWFENDIKINTQFMKGQWDDDCFDDYVVDICYFPLIGTELNNLSKSKVYIHAKVFPRSIAPLPPPTAKDHESLVKDASKSTFKHIISAPSYSTPSQNSANGVHSSDSNKHQNSTNSDHIKDKRKNYFINSGTRDPITIETSQYPLDSDSPTSPSSKKNRKSILVRVKNYFINSGSRDPITIETSQYPLDSDSPTSPNPDKRQNSANNDHNRDPKKRKSILVRVKNFFSKRKSDSTGDSTTTETPQYRLDSDSSISPASP